MVYVEGALASPLILHCGMDRIGAREAAIRVILVLSRKRPFVGHRNPSFVTMTVTSLTTHLSDMVSSQEYLQAQGGEGNQPGRPPTPRDL